MEKFNGPTNEEFECYFCYTEHRMEIPDSDFYCKGREKYIKTGIKNPDCNCYIVNNLVLKAIEELSEYYYFYWMHDEIRLSDIFRFIKFKKFQLKFPKNNLNKNDINDFKRLANEYIKKEIPYIYKKRNSLYSLHKVLIQ